MTPTICGLLAGVVLIALWLWWATGSFAEILTQAQSRSGSTSDAIGWPAFLEFQGIYLGALIGPVIIVGGGCGLTRCCAGSEPGPWSGAS